MEREYRAQSIDGSKEGRYAYYKRARVLEYANFIANKYFTVHKVDYINNDGSQYRYDPTYFEFSFMTNSRDRDAQSQYTRLQSVVERRDGSYFLKEGMIETVAESLADTVMYIIKLREKLKL